MSSEFSKSKKEWPQERAKKLANFDELLQDIGETSSKEKLLWKEIYDNAISDRQAANLCFMNLYNELTTSVEKHMLGGDKMAKYLERMEKSNTQLLKLAELIQKSKENTNDTLTEDELYAQMIDDTGKH